MSRLISGLTHPRRRMYFSDMIGDPYCVGVVAVQCLSFKLPRACRRAVSMLFDHPSLSSPVLGPVDFVLWHTQLEQGAFVGSLSQSLHYASGARSPDSHGCSATCCRGFQL